MGMKKTIHKVAIATIMIIALSAGMTFALLSQVTESVTNVFASDKNLSLELREPQWDGYTFKIHYEDSQIQVQVKQDVSIFTLVEGTPKTIYVYGEAYELSDKLSIPRKAVGA